MASEHPTSDELVTRLRNESAQCEAASKNSFGDYSEMTRAGFRSLGRLCASAADRIEQLQMPHAEVLRIAERGEDGADAVALMNALCRKVEAQRR
jgi:hypothetical protein